MTATPLFPRVHDRALAARARSELGFVPGVLHSLAPCPWLAHAEIAFYRARPAHVPARVCELAAYAIARDRGCRHTTGALAAFMRLAGYRDHELRAVEDGRLDALPEARAIEHALAVARGGGRETLARLDGHPPIARTELTGMCAMIVFGVMITIPLAPAPDGIEAFERSFLAKLLRPLIRNRIQAGRKPGAPPAGDEPNGALFASIIARLAGSPLQVLARDVLASAYASPLVAREDKHAIVSAVAGELGAAELAREAGPATAGELATYARATVHARPDDIHAAAQALRGALAPAAVLEVIGVTALAHALARLALVI